MTDTRMRPASTQHDPEFRALWALDELRLAEARLARRRQGACGPSQTARETLRIVAERADRGETVTPKQLAREVDVSPGGMTAVLRRLVEQGLVAFAPVAGDARSKAVVPARRHDPDAADPVSARLAEIVGRLDGAEAEVVERVMLEATRVVDDECR